MCNIRAFEENANKLYLSAKMPGLTHLYIGDEAIAVGVCETLRQDDYITSTHRGHGHCLAKGAAVDRMCAELLGKEAGYCRGKGRIADRVVPVEGQPSGQPMLTFTLSCDHRVVDGARGAQFLHTLVSFIEDPLAVLD